MELLLFYFIKLKTIFFQLMGRSGIIESPAYPLPYPHDRNCSWEIAAPKGSRVNITFSSFHLESHNR